MEVRRVLDDLGPREATVHTPDGRSFVRRVLPYRTCDDRIGGVVVTFVEVTRLLAAEGVAAQRRELIEQIAESAPMGVSVHELETGAEIYSNDLVARLLEQALRHSETHARQRLIELEHLYRHAPVGLGLIDREFRFVRMNERLAEINGVPREQTIGHHLRDVLLEAAGRFEAIHREIWATGEPIEDLELDFTPVGEADPRHYLASYYPMRSASGEITGTLGAVIDISRQHAIQRQLARSEAKHRRLLERLRGGVLEVDARGRVTYMNPTALQMFELEDHAKTSFEALVGGVEPLESRRALLDSAASLVAFAEPLAVVRAPSRHELTVHLQIEATEIPGARVGERASGMLYLVTDVSQRVAEEDRRSQLQRLEAIGRLASGVAHDFNNILQAILANTETVRGLGSAAEVEGRLDAIESSIARARDVVARILPFGVRDDGPGMSEAVQFTVLLPRAVLLLPSGAATTKAAVGGGGQTVFVLDDEEAVLEGIERLLERRGYVVEVFSDPSACSTWFVPRPSGSTRSSPIT